MWVYGSGFPKSLDISKAIDKQAGVKREVIGQNVELAKRIGTKVTTLDFGQTASLKQKIAESGAVPITAPATPEAKLWEGYGTALKPAYEPIILAMKPLDGTFADNALKHKVAGLNIDKCRIPLDGTENLNAVQNGNIYGSGGIYGKAGQKHTTPTYKPQGRFPANFILDGSQEVMELFPHPHSAGFKREKFIGNTGSRNINLGGGITANRFGDSGSAARFFYTAKASRAERDAGLEDMPERLSVTHEGKYRICKRCGKRAISGSYEKPQYRCQCPNPDWEYVKTDGERYVVRNNHPTVKPLALMTYLCKLVKMPEYNLILDPFCGSGSTLLACKRLGIPSIGIDSNEEYCEIASKRINAL